MNRLFLASKSLISLHSRAGLRSGLRCNSTVKISFFEESNNNMVEVHGEIGKTVLDVAIANNVDIEGACGGELACSTCHVIVPKDFYDKLPAKKEEEEDMLDLAMGLTPTSRLCCQLKVTQLLDGVVFKVPKDTNNML
eukprot:gene40106-48874_t